MKKAELLRTDHHIQLNWLKNQIGNIHFSTGSSFLKPDSALRAYNKLNDDLVVRETDLEHYISVYLSAIGIKKLVTALRVYRTRAGSERLQVEVTDRNRRKLNKLVEQTKKTKIEIINILIQNADVSDLQ